MPLQLQMLPSEMLPLAHNAVDGNGNVIRQGIEFDRLGRRAAIRATSRLDVAKSDIVLLPAFTRGWRFSLTLRLP